MGCTISPDGNLISGIGLSDSRYDNVYILNSSNGEIYSAFEVITSSSVAYAIDYSNMNGLFLSNGSYALIF